MMKMCSPLSLLFSLFLLIHTTNALDITQVLNQYPDFTNFNSYLTQTGLAVIINGQKPPVTILVVDNANASPLASKPENVLKNILSVHIVLDYFDLPKLQMQSTTTGLLTTFYQSTGLALGQQGFLNITKVGGGTIAFVSAMPGSSSPSNFVKPVHTDPYTLSILQISTPIIPQGIDGTKTSSPPSTTPVSTMTPPPPSIATPPTPSTVTPPSTTTTPTPTPTPSTISTATPPPASALVASTPPSMAPPTPGASAIPSTAPPTAAVAKAPIPSTTTPPMASAAPIASTTTPPTSSNAAPLPSSISPTASTPSSTPSAAPGSASAPGAAAPTTDEPGETTPAEPAPKAKSAGKSLDAGLALVFTMVLSAFYLASPMI